jgi:UDP-N-acetyl-D-mannosaminuronate dehydrogenase
VSTDDPENAAAATEVGRPAALRSGRDFFPTYSPEREDPGNPTFSATVISKVVGVTKFWAERFGNIILAVRHDQIMDLGIARLLKDVLPIHMSNAPL